MKLVRQVMLSSHISFNEMTTTSRSGLIQQNRIDAKAYLPALQAVCQMLEVVREHFGRPIIVHSGFRNPALNRAVGGSTYSQHMRGEAADFHVQDVPLRAVWTWIGQESGLAYGQCLLEGPGGGSWIHLSLGEPWRPVERSRQMMVIPDP